MQLARAVAALSLFASAAVAQDSLGDLMAQLPTCAMSCFESGATKAGCESATDFDCLCNEKAQAFLQETSSCAISEGGCGFKELTTAKEAADKFCEGIRNNPSKSDLAEASSVASSVLAGVETASPTSDSASDDSSSPSDTPGAAVARPTMGAAAGLVGAAAFAAFAI